MDATSGVVGTERVALHPHEDVGRREERVGGESLAARVVEQQGHVEVTAKCLIGWTVAPDQVTHGPIDGVGAVHVLDFSHSVLIDAVVVGREGVVGAFAQVVEAAIASVDIDDGRAIVEVLQPTDVFGEEQLHEGILQPRVGTAAAAIAQAEGLGAGDVRLVGPET